MVRFSMVLMVVAGPLLQSQTLSAQYETNGSGQPTVLVYNPHSAPATAYAVLIESDDVSKTRGGGWRVQWFDSELSPSRTPLAPGATNVFIVKSGSNDQPLKATVLACIFADGVNGGDSTWLATLKEARRLTAQNVTVVIGEISRLVTEQADNSAIVHRLDELRREATSSTRFAASPVNTVGMIDPQQARGLYLRMISPQAFQESMHLLTQGKGDTRSTGRSVIALLADWKQKLGQ